MSNPWDRREEETARAYHAFTTYLYLDTGRSLAKAAEVFYGPHKGAANVRQMEKWSAQWSWVQRVEAWEAHQREKEAREYEAARKKAKDDRLTIIRNFKVQVAKGIMRLNPEEIALKYKDLVEAFKVVMEQERIEYDDMPTSRQDITSAGKPIGMLTADMLAQLDQEVESELDDFERQFEEGDE